MAQKLDFHLDWKFIQLYFEFEKQSIDIYMYRYVYRYVCV